MEISQAVSGTACPSTSGEVIDLLYLLIKDYSAFTRNERVQWYSDHIVNRDSSFKTFPDTFTVLHHTSRDKRILDRSKLDLQRRLSRNGTDFVDPKYTLDFRKEDMLPFAARKLSSQNCTSTPALGADIIAFDQDGMIQHTVSIGMIGSEPVQMMTQPIGKQRDSIVLPSGARVAPNIPSKVETHPGMITSQTRVRVFAAKYRLVIVLDASPSLAVMDPETGEVVLDQVLGAFEKCLQALVVPIGLPGSSLQFRPQIFISVIAQGGTSDAFRVLLHGAFVTEKNIDSHIGQVKKSFRLFENMLVSKIGAARSGPSLGTSPAATPSDMATMFQNATVALKMLPADACPGVIVVSDGTSSLPEQANAYDNLIMLMNREDISCSVIQVGATFKPHCTFAQVPDADVLQHLANATFGVLLTREEVDSTASSTPPAPHSVDLRFSPLQFDLLSRPVAGPATMIGTVAPTGSNKNSLTSRHVTPDSRSTIAQQQLTADEYIVWDLDKLRGTMANDYPFPWRGDPPPQALFSVMVRQYQITGVPYLQLLDCRTREGFHLQSVSVQDDNIIVKLVLPWKTHIKALYTMRCPAPSAAAARGSAVGDINVTIDVLAYYDFIQQFTVTQRSSLGATGPGREAQMFAAGGQQQTSLSTRFQQLLAHLSETDRLLSYLITNSHSALRPLWDPLSLTANPTTASAVPNASTSTMARQYSEKMFWKVLSGLTKNAWHRWFRAERLEVVLTPDGRLSSDLIDFRKVQLQSYVTPASSSSSTAGTVPTGAVAVPAASNTLGSSTTDTSDNKGGSLSSQCDALRLKFRASLKELIKFFSRWATLSHSRHTYAKLLNYADLQRLNASTSSVSGSSSPPTLWTARTPAFCVVRLSWEANNLCILNIFFFGLTPEERLHVIGELRHDLVNTITPDLQNAFTLCTKPLRLVAIRYPSISNATSPSSPIAPAAASPSLGGRSSTSLFAGVSASSIVDSAILDDGADSSPPLHDRSSSHVLHSALPPSLSRHGSQVSFGAATQTPSNATVIEPPPTPLTPLQIISRLTPSFALMSQFMLRKRWIWDVGSLHTQLSVADALLKTRIREGWTMVQTGPSSHLFFREIELQPYFPISNTDLTSSTNVRCKCMVQYIVSMMEQQLFTELYMEPQDGLTLDTNERRLFRVLMALLFDIDNQMISTLYSFDTLVNSVGIEPEARELQVTDLDQFVSLVKPAFSLRSLVDLGTRHDETFKSFSSECNTADQRERQSVLLHGVLRHILSTICDNPVANNCVPALLNGAACFSRVINSNELTLAFLQPLDATTGPGSQLVESSPSSSASSSAGSFQSSTSNNSMVGASPLKVSVIQCFRGAEPPAASSRQLREVLQTRVPIILHDKFLPISQTTVQFCDQIQFEYRRGFVKALYTQLRDGGSICAADFEYALAACKEYVMDVDLTQFVRIVRRLPEGLRRSGGNKTSSATASAKDAAPPKEAEIYDVEKDFDDVFSLFFQRVPQSQWHFFYNPNAGPAAAGAGAADASAPTSVQSPDMGEKDADADTDPMEKPPEEKEEEMEEQQAESEDGWHADPERSPLNKSQPNQLGVFSFPFFVRLECAVIPKNAAGHDDEQIGSSSQQSSSMATGASGHHRAAPIPIGGSSMGKSSHHAHHHHHAERRQPIISPTLTLPTPKNQPSMTASSSSISRIALRVVCVVLPRHVTVNPNHHHHHHGGDGIIHPGSSPASFSAESPAGGVLDRPSTDSSASSELPQYTKLPKAIRYILAEAKRKIRSVVAQQILFSLHEKTPVTKPMMEAVQHYMAYLSPPALVRYSVPLWFHDPREGRDLFLLEMEQSQHFAVERLDRTFVVVSRNPPAAIAGSGAPQKPYSIPYWMIMHFTDDKIKIKFHSLKSRSEKKKEYERVRAGIKAINDRVNQLCLLYQLNETRMCNILLVPATAEDSRLLSSGEAADHSVTTTVRIAYLPGHFACPLVHEFRLPVFHRLDPREAEGALVAAALHHFSVSNRSSMYVVREQNGNIFYLRMSLVQESDGAASTEGSDSIGANPAAASTSNLAATAPKKSVKNFLQFRVHGVNPPTKEIVQDLPASLESKLADKALQSLAKLLLRNPLLKLTSADIELLKPAEQKPRRFIIPIPKCVTDVPLLCGYLKQNVMKQQLALLNFADAPPAPVDEMGSEFIYNNMISLPNLPAKLNFGQGVACLAVAVRSTLDTNLAVPADTDAAYLGNSSFIEFEETKLSETADSPACMHYVEINVWSRGAIKVEALLEHFCSIMNQTIVEYQFETYHGAIVDNLTAASVGAFISRSYQLFQRSSIIGTPNVRTLNTNQVNIPSWAMNQLLVELQEKVKEHSSNPQLYPNLYMNQRPPTILPVVSIASVGPEKAQQIAAIESELRAQGCTVVPSGSSFASICVMSDPKVDDVYTPFMVTNNLTQNLADPSGLLLTKDRTRFAIIISKQHDVSQQATIGTESRKSVDLPYSWATPSQLGTTNSSSSPAAVSPSTASVPSSLAKSISNQSITPASVLSTTATTASMPAQTGSVAYRMQQRRCFGMIIVSANQLAVMSYNWNAITGDSLFGSISQLQDWIKLRLHLLGNILHQKMGLFRQLPSISESQFSSAFAGLSSVLSPAVASAVTRTTSTGLSSASTSGNSSSNQNSPNVSMSSTGVDAAAAAAAMPGRGGMMKFNRFKAAPPPSAAPAKAPAETSQVGGSGPQRSGSSMNLATGSGSSSGAQSSASSGASSERSSSGQNVLTTARSGGLRGASAGSSTPNAGPAAPASALPAATEASSTPGAQSAQNSSDPAKKFRFDSHFELLMTNFVPPVAVGSPSKSRGKWKHKRSQPDPIQATSISSGLENIPFDSILRTASPAILPARKHDPVQRHALQLKQLAQRQQRLNQQAKVLSSIYSLWARTGQERDQSIDEDSLLTLLKVCRLHHACRIPFFIADLYRREHGVVFAVPPPSTNPSADGRSSDPTAATPAATAPSSATPAPTATGSSAATKEGEHKETKSTPLSIGAEQRLKLDSPPIPSAVLGTRSQIEARKRWRQTILAKFIDDYSKYLQTFGLVRVEIREPDVVKETPASVEQPPPGGSAYAKFDIYPESNTVYFQKVFRGGLLLIALGWDGPYVTLNLYSKFSYSQAVSSSAIANADLVGNSPALDGLRKRVHKMIKMHTEEASRIKDALHMNSFVYDFHVRQLSHHFEQGQPSEYPGDEVISMMQAMSLFYQGPKHARNSIRTSSFTAELGRSQLSPVEIFLFLSQNAAKYNLYATAERGISPGVFLVSSSSEMINRPRNRHGQLLEQLEEETYTLIACITDSNLTAATANGTALPAVTTDNTNLICQLGSWKKYFPDITSQVRANKQTANQAPLPSAHRPSGVIVSSAVSSSSASGPVAPAILPGGVAERIGSPTVLASQQPLAQAQPSSTSSFRNLAAFLHGTGSSSSSHSTPNATPSATAAASSAAPRSSPMPSAPAVSRAAAPPSSMSSARNLRDLVERSSTGLFSSFLNSGNSSTTASATSSSPASVDNAPVIPAPEPIRTFDVAFFVLRTNRGTIFPLSSVAQRLSMKQSPVAAVQAIVQQPEMQDAIAKSRLRLMECTQQAFVHSERDMLWTKLTREGSANDVALTEDQFKMLNKLVFMRNVEELDPSLKDMLNLTIDWHQLFQHLTTTFGNRSRRFSFDGIQHLLLFNAVDRDSMMYLTLETAVPSQTQTVDIFVCRREIRPTAVPYKLAEAEATLVSQVVNIILHWIWRSMVFRDRRPRQ